MVLEIRKAKIGLFKSKSKKAEEDAAAEVDSKCLVAEAAGEGEKKDNGVISRKCGIKYGC